MGVSLRDLLRLEAFQGSRVVAGAAGLDNVVRTVTVGEVPDQHRFIQGGELILTSFYAYRENGNQLIDLIRLHASSGVAGIGFKRGLWIDGLPEAVTAEAEEVGFPLVEIPADRRWSVLIECALDRIKEQDSLSVQESASIQSRLTQVLVSGGGLPAIAETLAQQTGFPVVVEDAGYRVLAAAMTAEAADDLRQAAERGESDPSFIQWLSTSDALTRLNDGGDPLSPPYETGLSPRVVFPITRNRQLKGFLTIGGSPIRLDRTHKMAAQHASAMVALELVQMELSRMAEMRSRGQVLERLLLGQRKGDELERQKAAPQAGVVMVVRPDQTRQAPPGYFAQGETEAIKSEILLELRRHFGDEAEPMIASVDQNIVLLIPYAPGEEINFQELRQVGEHLQARIKRVLAPRTVSVGMGRPCRSLSDIRRAYEEAVWALELNLMIRRQDCITYVCDVGVYELLMRCVDRTELVRFYTDMVRPLSEYDQKHSTELLKTLSVFLDNGKSITDTAAKLFLHRNGLTYRLRNISELTGIDFRNSDQCLNWHIALKLPEILSSSSR